MVASHSYNLHIYHSLGSSSLVRAHFSAFVAADSTKGGSGCGNVESKMLPSADSTDLFKHCKYPRTTAVIGYDYFTVQ